MGRPRKKYTRKRMSDKQVQKVWNHARVSPGKNPYYYRISHDGVLVYRHSRKYTSMSWHIDHVKPISKGGSDHLRNLRVMSALGNLKKGKKHTPKQYKYKKNLISTNI